ncbi:unnamed protein product [Amoebophrya sp. A120]|nr:unnamed protein product [Amoebophrya sp. A120]|eukprot:GSA120T00007222001.1
MLHPPVTATPGMKVLDPVPEMSMGVDGSLAPAEDGGANVRSSQPNPLRGSTDYTPEQKQLSSVLVKLHSQNKVLAFEHSRQQQEIAMLRKSLLMQSASGGMAGLLGASSGSGGAAGVTHSQSQPQLPTIHVTDTTSAGEDQTVDRSNILANLSIITPSSATAGNAQINMGSHDQYQQHNGAVEVHPSSSSRASSKSTNLMFSTSQQGGYLTGQGHGGGNHSASLSIRNKQEITKSTRTADDNSCSQPADSAGDGSCNSGSYNNCAGDENESDSEMVLWNESMNLHGGGGPHNTTSSSSHHFMSNNFFALNNSTPQLAASAAAAAAMHPGGGASASNKSVSFNLSRSSGSRLLPPAGAISSTTTAAHQRTLAADQNPISSSTTFSGTTGSGAAAAANITPNISHTRISMLEQLQSSQATLLETQKLAIFSRCCEWSGRQRITLQKRRTCFAAWKTLVETKKEEELKFTKHLQQELETVHQQLEQMEQQFENQAASHRQETAFLEEKQDYMVYALQTKFHHRSIQQQAFHSWKQIAVSRKHLLDLAFHHARGEKSLKKYRFSMLQFCMRSWGGYCRQSNRRNKKSQQVLEMKSTSKLLKHSFLAWKTHADREARFWCKYFFVRRLRRRELFSRFLTGWYFYACKERKLKRENEHLLNEKNAMEFSLKTMRESVLEMSMKDQDNKAGGASSAPKLQDVEAAAASSSLPPVFHLRSPTLEDLNEENVLAPGGTTAPFALEAASTSRGDHLLRSSMTNKDSRVLRRPEKVYEPIPRLTPLMQKYGLASPSPSPGAASPHDNFNLHPPDHDFAIELAAQKSPMEQLVEQADKSIRVQILFSVLDKMHKICTQKSKLRSFKQLELNKLGCYAESWKENQVVEQDNLFDNIAEFAMKKRRRKILQLLFKKFLRNRDKTFRLEALLVKRKHRIMKENFNYFKQVLTKDRKARIDFESSTTQKEKLQQFFNQKLAKPLNEKLARAVLQIWQSANSELKTKCESFVTLVTQLKLYKQREWKKHFFYKLKVNSYQQSVRDLEKATCLLAGLDKINQLIVKKQNNSKQFFLLQLKACSFGKLIRNLDMSCQFEVRQLKQNSKMDEQRLVEEKSGIEKKLNLVVKELEKCVKELDKEKKKSSLLEKQCDEVRKTSEAEKGQLVSENEKFKKLAEKQLEELQVAIAEEKDLLLHTIDTEREKISQLQDEKEQFAIEMNNHYQDMLLQQTKQLQQEVIHEKNIRLELQQELQQTENNKEHLRQSLENYCTVQEVAQVKIGCESDNLVKKVRELERQLYEEQKRFEESQKVVLSQSQELCRLFTLKQQEQQGGGGGDDAGDLLPLPIADASGGSGRGKPVLKRGGAGAGGQVQVSKRAGGVVSHQNKSLRNQSKNSTTSSRSTSTSVAMRTKARARIVNAGTTSAAAIAPPQPLPVVAQEWHQGRSTSVASMQSQQQQPVIFQFYGQPQVENHNSSSKQKGGNDLNRSRSRLYSASPRGGIALAGMSSGISPRITPSATGTATARQSRSPRSPLQQHQRTSSNRPRTLSNASTKSSRNKVFKNSKDAFIHERSPLSSRSVTPINRPTTASANKRKQILFGPSGQLDVGYRSRTSRSSRGNSFVSSVSASPRTNNSRQNSRTRRMVNEKLLNSSSAHRNRSLCRNDSRSPPRMVNTATAKMSLREQVAASLSSPIRSRSVVAKRSQQLVAPRLSSVENSFVMASSRSPVRRHQSRPGTTAMGTTTSTAMVSKTATTNSAFKKTSSAASSDHLRRSVSFSPTRKTRTVAGWGRGDAANQNSTATSAQINQKTVGTKQHVVRDTAANRARAKHNLATQQKK